jgi:hypothetical protein
MISRHRSAIASCGGTAELHGIHVDNLTLRTIVVGLLPEAA